MLGVGPNGGKGAIQSPVDLIEAPGNALFYLGESGAVFRLGPDGHATRYATGPVRESADEVLTPLSIALAPDGSILLAAISEADLLTIYRLTPGNPAERLTTAGKAKSPNNVHLVTDSAGEVLLLKDGWLSKTSGSGGLESLPRPTGLPGSAEVLAAAKDGQDLLLALTDELLWIRDGHIARRVRLRGTINAADGVTLAPDGQGGAYYANRSSHISRFHANGGQGILVTGRGIASTACSDGIVSGPTGDGRIQEFGEITGLVRRGDQLAVADKACSRLLAIGLPAKESPWK
ncbi:hypothetical protein [Bailinhaonella thermotolerans]|nr:hypothetical protein [Bailinhaonella thermotolerans]